MFAQQMFLGPNASEWSRLESVNITMTKFVRFLPKEWYRGIFMRVELYTINGMNDQLIVMNIQHTNFCC